MQRTLILLSWLLLATGACKKNHDSSSSSTWIFKGTTYQATMVTYALGGTYGNYAVLNATAIGYRSLLSFQFFPLATSNGEMLITDSRDSNTLLISVLDRTSSAGNSYFNGTTSVKANVAIINSKVSASFPGSIWLYNERNPLDSAQISVGTITQQ